jgi:hypothetical protein
MNQAGSAAYFDQHYSVIVSHPLVAARPILLKDHSTEADRRCRFCHRGEPEAVFGDDAHAVPAFLGNKSLFSLNECNECNHYLAEQYEDQLSKKQMFQHAATQLKGRNGVPTYKGGPLRIEEGENGPQITITDSALFAQASQPGPIAFNLSLTVPSQRYAPIRAAMALIKVACSMSPVDELANIRPAIDWLIRPDRVSIGTFPVLKAFTPGTNPYGTGYIMMLRRRTDEPIPYLWCILATGNFRFQFFVPFCLADAWLHSGEVVTCHHYPVPFGEDWPDGNTEFESFDWAGDELVADMMNVAVNVERAERIDDWSET